MLYNSTPNTYDFIIVGQGLAGSLVAHFLLKQNKKILIIDKYNPNSASNIATGVLNPITGRRLAKSWMIDDILPFAISTYRNLETQLQTSFFYEQDVYKLFTSEEDLSIWNKKKYDVEYKNYLGDIVHKVSGSVETPFGAGIIKQSCWLDVPTFVKAYREFLISENAIIDEVFDFNNLIVSDNIKYKNIIADKIIFCEGYKSYKNPFFNFVEFSFAKGEQFVIHAPDLKNDKMLSKYIFILPKNDDNYRVGSTFIWDDLSELVTNEGRNEINERLKKIINCTYTVVEEKAGIRPTIKDRRPVVGAHPNFSNVFIFNGLGTKGVSLAPYFSLHLINNLIHDTEILDEINVKRFYKN